MLAAPVVSGAPLDRALAGRDGPRAVSLFLSDVAPGDVLDAVGQVLPPGIQDTALRLVRAKLKPERTLTAEYDVVLPSMGRTRRIWVTWAAAGTAARGPAVDAEAEARRRGVLAPFRRSWAISRDGRMSVSVSPVDGAFPQLVRLHDPEHLAGLLGAPRAVGRAGGVTTEDVAIQDVAIEDVAIETVRYRPGQRHVLRLTPGAARPACYAKVYRDDTGWRAVAAAAWAAAALEAEDDGVDLVSAVTGTYVAADRVALWPEVTGPSLATALRRPDAGDLVRAAGRALRRLHDRTSADDLPARPDAAGQAEETLRTARVVEVLVPRQGARLRREVGRALESLSALPTEPPVFTHGDVKCDNLVVSGPRLHLLDFDRAGRGDPAADLGKFLADLRWWTAVHGLAVAPLHAAFLAGYGDAPPARLARARVHDGLMHLRMAARRVPIQDAGWEGHVTAALDVATATLTGELTGKLAGEVEP